jgi:hypothetical protein
MFALLPIAHLYKTANLPFSLHIGQLGGAWYNGCNGHGLGLLPLLSQAGATPLGGFCCATMTSIAAPTTAHATSLHIGHLLQMQVTSIAATVTSIAANAV